MLGHEAALPQHVCNGEEDDDAGMRMATCGACDILSPVTEVATQALKAAWPEK